MGDRCAMVVAIAKGDEKKWLKELFGLNAQGQAQGHWDDTFSAGPRWKEVLANDINYGGLDAREKLAKAGCTFFGYHDAGVEYGSACFVAVNDEHVDVPGSGDGLMVGVDDDGKVSKKGMADIKKYRRLLKLAKAKLGIKEKKRRKR